MINDCPSSVQCFVQESSELQKQRVCDKVHEVFLILEGKQKVGYFVDSLCGSVICNSTIIGQHKH